MDFPGHFHHIFQQLNLQRLHAQLCDCVVVVGGQKFQAHRSILAACSSHFRALLSSSDSSDEVGADKSPCVMVLDPEVVTPEAFSTLLEMIYTSTLSLRASNVMDVLLAASHLHLNTVVKACKLHLSRKNFPASPPNSWKSVQQQQGPSPQALQTSSAVDEDLDEVGVEVSQSGGGEDEEVRWSVSGEQSPAPSSLQKRKSYEERLNGRKRSRILGDQTRSSVSTEGRGDELLSPPDKLWEGRGEKEEEVEEKYEATKGELEEVQLPSQSDSGTGGSVCQKDGSTDGDTVVKVKVGDEGEEEAVMIEVKKENLSSCSPDVSILPNKSAPAGEQDSAQHSVLNSEKMSPTEGAAGGLQSQLCSELPGGEAGDVGEESVDGDGLDSLSELAFSCFLNPTSGSEIGALEEEDSLSCLTAAAAASEAATGDESQLSHKTPSDPSSSLVFPVTSVPLQQLLPMQGSSFSDALILQPAQSSLAGFLSLEPSLVQTCKAGRSRGCGGSGGTTFRRIAPKVPPGSEAETPSSSGPAGDDQPPLTKASEDVLSKCKKAAAEDHVLLVEGEKKYACKICCKTFMNLTDCKKHIRVHTGEKPYPCPKCGKRFSQSSHLYKHSKNATCLSWKDDHSFAESLP
ncbi:zinc finger and BTB domain-containing protein 5-like [Aulostomus maculatus]